LNSSKTVLKTKRKIRLNEYLFEDFLFFGQHIPREAPAGMDFIGEDSSFHSRVLIHYSFSFLFASAENSYSFHFSPIIHRADN
jgi:hypothetical protein